MAWSVPESPLRLPRCAGPGKPGACATASTPPLSASSRPATWNAKVTVPTASSQNWQTTLAANH